ncbi:MAG: MBL fold metallo-hydrolase [Bacteroidales bacterium]|nr:MBL fold metallo-hydrolase [Bacteroidales bacterium]
MKRIIYFLLAFVIIVGCKGRQHDNAIDSNAAEMAPCTVFSEMDDMEVIAIPDRINQMSIDLFKGSYNDSLLAKLMPDGSSPSAINVFLVRASGYYYDGHEYDILIDAGIGEDAGGTLLPQLKKLGVKLEEIDAVCLTHLHADHIGGLIKEGQPVFPNAEIYLSVDEFNAWSDDGPMAEQNDLWKRVLSCYANHINLFQDGDTLIDGWIVAHLMPGHTPGHTVYESGLCLFIGDLIHAQDLQIPYPDFCARYDFNPALAVKSRKEIIGKPSDIYLCGAHCYEPFIGNK